MRQEPVMSISTTFIGLDAHELHGFERFESAPQLMAFVGLTPSEYSSAGKRQQGSITKTGNTHVRRILVEVAWNYRHAPRVGAQLRKRRARQSPRTIETADKAMRRLYARWRKMDERRKPSQKIVVAAARELMGFIWAALAEPPNTSEVSPPRKVYKLATKAR
jgi:transposase